MTTALRPYAMTVDDSALDSRSGSYLDVGQLTPRDEQLRAVLEFRVLGPVQVWFRESEIPLGGSKQRTVLAALLLARGKVVTDAALSTVLWGEDPPRTSS